MKYDFERELKELKRLEARAKATGIDFHKKEAEIRRSLLMSYKGMTRELEVVALGKGKAFRQKVENLIEKKDVEEIHRLWSQYCEGK